MTQKDFLILIGWLSSPKLQAKNNQPIIAIIKKENDKIIAKNKITEKIYEIYLSKSEKYLLIDKNNNRVRAFCLAIAGGQEIKRAFYTLA